VFRFKELHRINRHLSDKVHHSGTEKYPYVRLDPNHLFFSHFPTAYQKLLYPFLKKNIRAVTTPNSMNVLSDIVNRYYFPLGDCMINEGDVVMEVGAYLGYWAVRASRTAKEVIAVEPLSDNYLILKLNTSQKRNIRCLPVAVGRREGFVKIYTNRRQANSIYPSKRRSEKTKSVMLTTIDTLIQVTGIKRLDVLRIQVNGAEADVLRGFTTIKKYKPKLVIAVRYNQDVVKMVQALGYTYIIKDYNLIGMPK